MFLYDLWGCRVVPFLPLGTNLVGDKDTFQDQGQGFWGGIFLTKWDLFWDMSSGSGRHQGFEFLGAGLFRNVDVHQPVWDLEVRVRVRVWSWFFWGLLFAIFLFVFSSRFVVCCDHEDLGFVESPSPSSLRCGRSDEVKDSNYLRKERTRPLRRNGVCKREKLLAAAPCCLSFW